MANPVTPPGYLVHPTFLGQSCGAGVNPVLATKLQTVQQSLQNTFNALPSDQKFNPLNGQPTASFTEWCGIVEPHKGWYPGGFHASGSAIDINYTIDPYIVTRTGSVLGGEVAAQSLQAMRQQVVSVYDRAMQFAISSTATADVSGRKMIGGNKEATRNVYDSFKVASMNLAGYLSLVFSSQPTVVNRKVMATAQILADPTKLSDTAVENAIPESGQPNAERFSKAYAVANIQSLMADAARQRTHQAWTTTAEALYYQILRDYESVRIPMVTGSVSETPQTTRNPAHLSGFLNIIMEIVVAMCDVGQLRWGACDFGAQQSG